MAEMISEYNILSIAITRTLSRSTETLKAQSVHLDHVDESFIHIQYITEEFELQIENQHLVFLS